MSWTDERIELLKKLWSDGLSASQIAAELGGVTRNAVIGKVHRLGLSGRVKSSGSAAPRARKPAQRPAQGGPTRVIGTPSFTAVRGNVALKAVALAEEDLAPYVAAEIEEVVVPMSRRVSIMELKEGVCRWPMGDPMAEDFVYCGADCKTGAVYCGHHSTVAYQASPDRRRAPAMPPRS